MVVQVTCPMSKLSHRRLPFQGVQRRVQFKDCTVLPSKIVTKRVVLTQRNYHIMLEKPFANFISSMSFRRANQ